MGHEEPPTWPVLPRALWLCQGWRAGAGLVPGGKAWRRFSRRVSRQGPDAGCDDFGGCEGAAARRERRRKETAPREVSFSANVPPDNVAAPVGGCVGDTGAPLPLPPLGGGLWGGIAQRRSRIGPLRWSGAAMSSVMDSRATELSNCRTLYFSSSGGIYLDSEEAAGYSTALLRLCMVSPEFLIVSHRSDSPTVSEPALSS
jgi:hypothetical protein